MGRRKASLNSVSFFAFQDIITSVVGIFVLITLIMALELAQTVENASNKSNEGVSSELLASLASLQDRVKQMQAEFDAQSSAKLAASDFNRFNREELLNDAKARVEQIQQQTTQTQHDLAEVQQSLVDARKIGARLLAQGQAAEAESEELKRVQDQRKRIERYSAVLEIDKPLIFRDRTAEGRWVVLVKLENEEILVADSATAKTLTFTDSARQAQFATWVATTALASRQFFVIVKPSGVEDFDTVQNRLDSAGALWGFDLAEQDSKFKLRFEMGMPP